VAAQGAARRGGRLCSIAATATAAWISFGGTSLARTGVQMAELLDREDIAAARRLLPSLCGRDPERLDGAGLARAALESVAENTSDAQVAPMLWATVGGTPGALTYRASTPGFDDRPPLAAVSPVRLGRSAIGRRSQLRRRAGDRGAGGGVCAGRRRITIGCRAGLAGGRRPASQSQRGRRRGGLRGGARSATRRAHPVHHELQIRPTLGNGAQPTVDALRRAVVLSRVVQAAAALFAGSPGHRVCVSGVERACRAGNRDFPALHAQ